MRKRRRCFFLVMAVLSCCVTVYFPILLSIQPDEELDTWNITRNMSILVRPSINTTLIGSDTFCSSASPPTASSQSEPTFLLVVICSAMKNFQARAAIRETWGSKAALVKEPKVFGNSSQRAPWKVTSGWVKLVFMLGHEGNESSALQDRVVAENEKYNDIIQEDFLDTYNNLTLKSVMMLKWVNSNCKNARFVMKTDDDTFVNIPRLVAHLQSLKPNIKRLLFGALICGAAPVKNKHSKWYTPKVLYSERFYPNYLSGTGYVLSGDMVPLLYETALTTPFFHLEDVYTTGICAKSLKVKPKDHQGFSYQRRALDPCLFHLAITGHRMTAEDTRYLWKKMWDNDSQLSCDPKKIKLRDFRPGKCV